MDDVAVEDISKFEAGLHEFMETQGTEVLTAIAEQKELTEEIETKLKASLENFKQVFRK